MWQPSPERIANANLTRFMRIVGQRHGIELTSYRQIYEWSIAHPEAFWAELWSFGGVIGDRGGKEVLIDGHLMPGAKWFPHARLNFAENLLRRRDDDVALVFRGEDRVRAAYTH